MFTLNTHSEQSIPEPKVQKGIHFRNYGGGKKQLVFIDECFYKRRRCLLL